MLLLLGILALRQREYHQGLHLHLLLLVTVLGQ